jgi:hypothetical protein
MSEEKPPFFVRFLLAFAAFWRILINADFAAGVLRLRRGKTSAETAEKAEAVAAPMLKEASPDAALQLLGLLQREGRFIDFLEEEVSGYSDAEIGAAARVVHDGCRKVLHEHFSIQTIRDEQEGTRLTLAQGFDASSVRVTGNVVGEPPFSGTLTHRGWRAAEVRLPKIAAQHDATVLAPAEVEL